MIRDSIIFFYRNIKFNNLYSAKLTLSIYIVYYNNFKS